MVKKTTKNNLQRFFGFLPTLAIYIFCIYIVITLLTCCFVLPYFNHPLQRTFVNLNIIFLTISVLICLAYIFIIKIYKCKKHKDATKISTKSKFKKFLIWSTIVLFILQMLVIAGKLFIAGWDVGRIYFTTPVQDYYFSIYPNNLFLKGIVALFTDLIKLIPGLTDLFIQKATATFAGNEALQNLNNQTAAECINYVIAVVLNCILVNVSVLMSSLICKKHISTKVAITEYIVAAIFIGLMPWILVPYSDTIALFFITLILFAYMNIDKKSTKYSIIAFATIIGFNIKPTVIFATIAIILIELCQAIYNHNKKNNKISTKQIKIIIKNISCTAIVVIVSFLLISFVKSLPEVNIDKSKEYTSTHFLMMGANKYSYGCYARDDVAFSDSFQTVEEREEHNIQAWKERIEDLGVQGTFNLMLSKNMSNYADGSFMWGLDSGEKFSMINICNNSIINWIYDNFYYFAQIIWFGVLLGVILNLFLRNKNRYIAVMSLTLLMLSVFLMIFECGSRYLILYLPYFVIMSSFGWYNLSAIIQGKFLKTK